jgi:hypothetical protein
MSTIKNAAVFEQFIAYCSGYGGSYNPGLPNLTLSALNELMAKAKQSYEDMNVAKSSLNIATNSREIAFGRLPKLVSAVIFTLASSGASEQTLKDARVFFRQMTSRKLKSRGPVASEAAEEKPDRERSYSQRSYVSMVGHFAQLVQIATDEPLYKPNEVHLTIAGLNETLESLRSLNKQVTDAKVTWGNAAVILRRVYYGREQSLYSTSLALKKYVRGAFGLQSEEYQQIIKLNIIKPVR